MGGFTWTLLFVLLIIHVLYIYLLYISLASILLTFDHVVSYGTVFILVPITGEYVKINAWLSYKGRLKYLLKILILFFILL